MFLIFITIHFFLISYKNKQFLGPEKLVFFNQLQTRLRYELIAY